MGDWRSGRGLRSRIGSITGGASLVPLLLLFGLNAVDELDRTAFSVLLPEIQKDFGLSLTGVTTLVALVIPAGLIVGVPVARLADRRRRVPIAIIGAAAWGLFSMVTGIVPTLVLLGMARIGAGLGRAVNDPVHGSLLSDYYPPSTRTRVFGAHRAANTVGAFCGPLIAGFIANWVGWRVPFIVLAIPTFVLIALAILWLREPLRTGRGEVPFHPKFRDSFRALWRVPTLRRMWLAFPFLAFVAIGLTPLLALYYKNLFGVSVQARGIIQAFDAPFIVLGLLVASPLIDRGIVNDPGRVQRRIALVAGLIAVLIIGLAVAPRLWVGIVFAYAIISVAIVLYAGGFAVVSLVAPPEARASAFAFFNISSLLGAFSLPLVGAVGDAFGIRWGIGILAPVLVIGSRILASSARHVKDDIARVNPDRVPEPDVVLPPSPPAPGE